MGLPGKCPEKGYLSGVQIHGLRRGLVLALFVVVLFVLAVRIGLAGENCSLCQGRNLSIAGLGGPQQFFQMTGVNRDLVRNELQGRGQPYRDVLAHLGAQDAFRGLQRLAGVRLLGLVAENRVVKRGVLQVVGDAGVRNGDKSETRVLDPALQRLCNHNFNSVCQFCGACWIGHSPSSWCVGEGAGARRS